MCMTYAIVSLTMPYWHDLICLMCCTDFHYLISSCNRKSAEVNLVYHFRLTHPLAGLYQGTFKSHNANSLLLLFSFQKWDSVVWYPSRLICISLTIPEGLAVYYVSLNHPCTLEKRIYWHDANDAMCLAGGLTFAGIFLAHSCRLQTRWLLSIIKWAWMPPDRECLFLLCSLQFWCIRGVTGALFV